MEENKRPKISIITAVLNNREKLEKTILSVIEQTYQNIEYIIIDGGSTDDSLEIIKKYQNRISFWLSEKDGGLYDAMNKGIKKATGDWLIMLNSGDYYVGNDVFEKVAKHLNNPEKKFYYFSMLHEFSNGIKKTYKNPIYWWNRWKLFYSAYIPHMALIASKEQYQNIGLYDINLKIAADHDFILRLMKKYRPIFIDIPLSVMEMGGISAIDPRRTFKEFRDATIKNGLPKFLAELIFRFKMWKHKFLKIEN